MDGAVLVLSLHRRLASTLEALETERTARFHLLTHATEELFALMATEAALFDLAFDRAGAGELAANQALLIEAHHELLAMLQARSEPEFAACLVDLRRTLALHTTKQQGVLIPALGSTPRKEWSEDLARRIDALLCDATVASSADASTAGKPTTTRRIGA
jgi:hypothetical protein